MKSTVLLIATATSIGDAMGHVARQALGFDPTTQAVSVSGEHTFRAPGPGDMRGPCPGLNAMANHGYIPRNGFVSIPEAVEGISATFGMGLDFATLFAIAGAVEAGDGFSFSIGGPPPSNLIAGGLLGHPQGLSASHNRIEGDASISRNDLYTSGDAHTLQLPLFKGLLDSAGEKENYDINVLGDYSAVRYNHSLFNNPYFFRGPAGVAVPPGAAALVAHLFSNKSAEHPNGFLSRSTLKSFYGVTGDADNLQKTPERIPELFYKWGPTAPYTTASFVADLTTIYLSHPETLVLGGNTGKVNTMTPVNVASLTGGVYNAGNLLRGNNLGCFLFQALAFETPDIISNSGIIDDTLGLVARKLQSAVSDALAGLSCPQLAKFDGSQLSIFPGNAKFSNRSGTSSSG